jgi:hypothetical protein
MPVPQRRNKEVKFMPDPGLDHDLLIRIDENVKAIKDRCAVCARDLEEHEDRIASLEGEVKAVKVQHGIWSALAVGVSGALSAALRWVK